MLTQGQRLGPYEITAPLGVGGMGEVYRARDEKLRRDVALKVLPTSFAADAERLARFEREAQLLASLNHPNVGAIHGFEESDGVRYLVLELVPGDTLAERLAGGPLPLDEVLAICRQIAEALEAAHENGIVHRDLKPANVKVTPNGKVKVLDFGLAKAFALDTSSGELSHSPTITAGATRDGVILGTAAYMSPEQARGRPVDKRTDIWAFGCVLYETLTGQRAFTGETVSDTLAGILRSEPDWNALPAECPAPIRRLLRRCLQKDAARRLHDIADARLEIEEAIARPGVETFPPTAAAAALPVPAWRRGFPWALAAVLLAATAVLGWIVVSAVRRPPSVLHASIAPPTGTSFQLARSTPGVPAVSPDGRSIAFTAIDANGEYGLYVRRFDAGVARLLPETSGAQYPFWSPDSRSVGFFTGDKLRTIAAGGGPPTTICAAQGGKGATWSVRGIILFAPDANSPIFQVSDRGGEPKQVTTLDDKRGDSSHRHPRFLPDGRHFLYVARPGVLREGISIVAASLDGPDQRVLIRSSAAAEYSSGHLLYLKESTLVARPFDADRLAFTDEPLPVAERIRLISPDAAIAVFSASQNGVLVFQTAEGEATSTLRLVSRDGKTGQTVGERKSYRQVALSPDGKLAAVPLRDAAVGGSDIWIVDVARGVRTRFTFDPGDESGPVWSPDGSALAFASSRKGRYDIYVKSITGSREEELVLASDMNKYPMTWSRDGRYLFFVEERRTRRTDMAVISMTGERKRELLLSTQFIEYPGELSPDGRWLAYGSAESGNFEIFVTSFPRAGRRWQVSPAGGAYPFWRSDGKEIVYQGISGQITAVPVLSRGDTLEFGPPQELFKLTAPAPGGAHFAPTADHQKFLIVSGGDQQVSPLLELVVNWQALIRRQRD